MSLFSDINGYNEKSVKTFGIKYDKKTDEDYSAVDFCVSDIDESSNPFASAYDINFEEMNSEFATAKDEFIYNYELSEGYYTEEGSTFDFEG